MMITTTLKRVSRYALCVLLVGVLTVSVAQAQEAQPGQARPGAPPPMRFESYGQQQGFQGRYPRDFLLDRYGFAWVASQKGIARFDGIRFEYVFGRVPLEGENTPGFSVATELAEADDGDIWGGMILGGMVQVDRQTGRSRYVPPPSDYPASPGGQSRWMTRIMLTLFKLSDGRMARLTYNGEADGVAPGVCLDVFDPATDTYTPIRTGLPSERLPDHPCEAYVDHSVDTGPWYSDRRGRLWLGAEGGLLHLEPGADSLVGTHSFYPEPYPAAGLARLDRLVGESPPLAALTRVGKGEDGARVFDLQEATRVLLVGSGELHPWVPGDAGWLESASGDTLWAMDLARSAWGGGRMSNRLVVDTLTLPGGRYRLRYQSDGDDWHFGRWQYTFQGSVIDRSDLAPSRPAWWGLQVLPLPGPANTSSGVPPITDGPGRTEPHFPILPNAFLEARDGSLWIGTLQGKLVRYDPEADRYDAFPLGLPERYGIGQRIVRSSWGVEARSDVGVVALHEADAGTLWVGVGGVGLYRLDPQTGRTRHYAFLSALDEAMWPEAHVIYRILSDPDGTVWVGTGSGLVHLDPETGGFNIYGSSLEANVPPATPVVDLMRGPNGGLWFSSYQDAPDAVFRLAGRAEPIRVLTHTEGEERSLPPRRITGIVEAEGGAIWVGSDRGLLQYDAALGALVEPDLGAFQAELAREVLPLLAEAGGELWVIDRARRALYRYNPDAGTLATFDAPDAAGLYPPQFRRAGDAYWFTTDDNGFFRFDPDRDAASDTGASAGDAVFTRYPIHTSPRSGGWDPSDPDRLLPFISDSLNQGELFLLHVGSDGGLWIGTDEGGLVRFDPERESFAAYYDGTSLRGATGISESRDGRFWLASFNGPMCFDPATGEVTVLDLPGDVGSLTSTMLIEDDAGVLWNVTRRGLYRFDPERGVARNIGAEFGTSSPPPHLKLQSGEILYAGRDGGLVVLDPAALPADTTPPRVVLKSLTTENEPDGASDGDAENASENEALSLYDRASLDLPYARNDLTFAYVGLEYDAPEAVTYEYRLEGYDERWQEAGTQRSARYTNLPAGRYTFRVRARNVDGYWSDPEQAAAWVALVVQPPWWQTWWARLAGLLAIVGLAVLGGRRYARQAEARAAVLEATVAERTADLRAEKATTEAQAEALAVQAEELRELDAVKSRFFANVSHELRTPLTLLLGPVKDALDPQNERALDRLRRHLPLMARNGERLLALIGQLLDLAKLEGGGMHLHARELDLVVFAGALTDGFASRAERLGLSLVFDAGGRSLTRSLPVWADADKLEKVIVNLVSNAVKFTPEGGKVRVRVGYRRSAEGESPREGYAELSVQDTGPGIPPDQLPYVFDRFHQVDGTSTRAHEGAGIGLALARELVELHRGTLSVESTEGFGSTFTVRLPLGNEHLSPDEIVEEGGGAVAHSPSQQPSSVSDAQVLALLSDADEATTDAATADEVVSEEAPDEAAPLVLVVEDNADMRAYLRSLLEPTYRVVEAADGAEGVAHARRLAAEDGSPALVISDIMMPGTDGYTLCRTLKGDPNLEHLPVVLLTARADDASRLEGLTEGADAYLAKPFSADELMTRAENLIALRRRMREHFGGRVVVGATEVEVPSAEAAWLAEARDIVEAHIGDTTFGVDRLADEMAMSTRQLHRRMKGAADLTPLGFIRMLRLERAAQLLEQGAGGVAEVAYAVGYQTPDYFSRQFREVFGVPPSTYADGGGPIEGE